MKVKSCLFKPVFLISFILLANGSFNSSFLKNCNMNNHLDYNPQLKSSNSNNWSLVWDFYQSIGEHIITDKSNNIYIAGRTFNVSNDKSQIVNVKFNKFGSEQWNECWVFNNQCSIKEFAIDSESNIYNLVSIQSFPNTKNILMKIDSSGFSEWNKTIEGTIECVHLDKYDNIYISRYIWDWTYDIEYIYLNKFDQNGKSLWNNTFRNKDFFSLIAYPLAIMVDNFNQTYIAGLINSNGFPNDPVYYQFGSYIPAPYVYISIYNTSGVLTSLHKWRIYDYYVTSDIILDSSYNIYLMGIDKSINKNILLKYDFYGNLLFSSDWHRNAIEETYEFWQDIAQDPLNHTYCAGVNYWDRKNYYEIYLVKFDDQGNIEWDGAYDVQNTYCGDLHIDSNFNIYLTGSDNGKMLILKNPILIEITDPVDTNPVDNNINLLILICFIVGISGLGIFLFFKYVRRSP